MTNDREWIIVTTLDTDHHIMLLAWQSPAWDKDGYFWTSAETFDDCINSGYDTPDHPFTFATQHDALIAAQKLNLMHFIIAKRY